MLTGTGIQIGSVEDFGANIRYARGLATDGTTVWLFDASRGYTLNTTTGAAFAVAPSVTGFDNSETTVRSATYHDSQVLVFGSSQGRIQVFDTTAGTLTNWHSNAISYAGSEGGVPALWGFTSLNGTLYALDRQVSALYTVSRVGVLTRVGDATAFGINSANPRGLTAYRNMLIGSDPGLGKIFVIDPVTGVGTIIGETNTLPDDNAEALVEFDGQLLMAGSQNDALFRLYDVLWDETIATLEIDEGTSGTLLDLSTVSQDAVSFSLQGTPPSWLSIADSNLVATDAPDVTADTDYDVEVRATRDSVNVDKTLGVTVRTPALSFGSGTIADQSLSVGDAVNLTLPEATGGDPTIVYSLTPATLPDGLSFDAVTRVLSGTTTGRFTSAEFTYTATDGNNDTVTLTFTIVVTADAITFSPASFANQSWTVGTAVDLTLPEGAGGVGDLTASLSPALPSGITFTAGTRALAGTPTDDFASATFTYTMTDAEGVTASISFTIEVNHPELTFGSETIADQTWETDTAVNLTLPASTGGAGGTEYTLSPALPAGLTFDETARTITGTPTAALASTEYTYTATDDDGTAISLTFDASVTAPNNPPTISITVPMAAEPGDVLNIVAVTADVDGDTVTVLWDAADGTIADDTAESTTWTLPNTEGVYTISCTATDEHGATAEASATVTVSEPQVVTVTPPVFESHKVSVRLEIEGEDLTTYLPSRSPLSIGKSRDFPNLGVFKSGRVNIPLQNASGMFDPGNASNFFTAQGLPANGRGAKVLVQVVRDGAEVFNFAGEVVQINQTLGSSIVTLAVRDLSVRLRRAVAENFGATLTRRITDFEGANSDYTELNPVFQFPTWGLPISPGSVTMTVREEDADVSINIVDVVKTTGTLSNRNAEIDYAQGVLRFEAAPADGEDTEIDATWKQAYQYKRPDFLARSLLSNAEIQDRIGITDAADARFAIEQALWSHGTDRSFSSHGRPYFDKHGVTRWIMRDDSGDTPDWWMAHENRLVKYDESLDEYEEVAEVPDDDTIDQAPPGGYGAIIEDESFTLPSGAASIAVTETRIYLGFGLTGVISAYDRSLNAVASENISTSSNVYGIDTYDGRLYVVHSTAGILVYNLVTQTLEQTITPTGLTTNNVYGIAVTPDRIFLASEEDVDVLNHSGTVLSSFSIRRSEHSGVNGFRCADIEADADYIYVHISANSVLTNVIEVYTHTGSFVSSRSIGGLVTSFSTVFGGISISQNRLYAISESNDGTPRLDSASKILAISLVSELNYHSFVIQQFDTYDYESFYVLSANTLSGDITHDTTFNQVRIQKYVESTDTWSTLLDPTTDRPQLAHPVDLINEIGEYADNRKNFQVVRRSSKTLIFYRRVQTSEAGIAYYNETDDTLTNIYSETFGTNDGLPYSMDFVLDERSDGIYVYTFVVKYTVSGSTFTSATLKIYRERVEPSAAQTEIFSETFTGTTGTDEYPISVSDIILADDRSKFYFVLEYFSESTTEAGKSELCEIAKSGSGSRTVLKTYDDPLVGPRSPVKRGSDYFYLEGGWTRRASDDDDQPDKFYYPNEGGHLIEIESNGDITDHGVVWRSADVLDSPDPENEDGIYDGWGLFNAAVSNTVVDDRGNLHFIVGYGVPYAIANNLPIGSILGPAPDASNFVWLQWGKDLASKVPLFPTGGSQSWGLIARLAQSMNWEIGFGPRKRKVDALQAADASITDWQANTSFFLRPRTIIPAELRTAIGASETVSTIELDYLGLPAERLEFPAPPSGESFKVLIDKEIFSYTGASEDSQGVELSGVTREIDGSDAAAHSADADVFFVDGVIRDTDNSLVSVQDKNTDLSNLYNVIVIRHRDGSHRVEDSNSIESNGEHVLTLNMQFLSNETFNWLELLAAEYLERFKDFKDVVTLSVPYSPLLELGQLLVLKIERGFVSDYEKYEVMRVRDNLRGYQTTLDIRKY